jgi:hypothetical protein
MTESLRETTAGDARNEDTDTRDFSHPLLCCCYMSLHALARCFYHLQLEIHLEVIHS